MSECSFPTGVAGAPFLRLRVVRTGGGAVLRMLRPDMPLLPGRLEGPGGPQVALGEVYFSEVLPGEVKAWKRHSRQTQHVCVPSGRIGLALYDGRPDSPTFGTVAALVLGRDDLYALVRIPPGVLYGFRGLGDGPALVCNAPDLPHDPEEGEKVDPKSPEGGAIPFDWSAPFEPTIVPF